MKRREALDSVRANVDLGPAVSDQGGYVVTTGTPEEISQVKVSATRQYLGNALPKDAVYYLKILSMLLPAKGVCLG